MELHCRLSYSEAAQVREIASADMETLLAVEGHYMVGYAQLRWAGAPECVPARAPGEIRRLYVVQEWHGRGVAQALMRACLAAAEARGTDAVWLGVWERNPRAIAFYRKFGFSAMGEHVFTLGRDFQRDIVMVRTV